MDQAKCPGCRDMTFLINDLRGKLASAENKLASAEAKIGTLANRVDELSRKLEESSRAAKRQSAPFRKGPPKPDPKPPGRKSGEAYGTHGHRRTPNPDDIDEVLEAPLPDACPECQGRLVEEDVVEQFQTDIPRQPVIRKFRIHRGHCSCCRKKIQGRHELQTSDAIGAAASQIGPDAQAAAATLHSEKGLSFGKVADVFDSLFGIKISRGATAQINLRAAKRLENDYQSILDDLRRPQNLTPDETGWRVGGNPAWLHVWVGERATAYAIDSKRSANALERVIGIDWSGVMIHDGYATYDRFVMALHQTCVDHVLRRARGLLEKARGGAVRFPRQIISLFTEAVHLRNEYLRGAVALDFVQDQRDVFDDRLLELLRRPRALPEYTRLAKHLVNHFEQCFTFVFDPTVEATNWQAEQAIRPAVVNRKVFGGNRTEAGAKAQGILMSVFETVKKQGQNALDYLSESLRSFGNHLLPKPQILLGR